MPKIRDRGAPEGRQLVADGELWLIRSFEARPRRLKSELGDWADLRPLQAWRLYERLLRRGLVKTVTAFDPTRTLGACECRAFLKLECLKPKLASELERTLGSDRRVMNAAFVTGTWDYVIRAFHPNESHANAWFRALLEAPGVANGQLNFYRTIVQRSAYAAAILGSGAKREDGI